MKMLFGTLVMIAVLCGCKKDSGSSNSNVDTPQDDGISQENKDKAAALQVWLEANKFQLSKYYSDEAIDYIDTDDVVKAETNLWPYVSGWLKDDVYSFSSDDQVTIEQNSSKIPSDSNAIITKPYSVKADTAGVAFDFMGNEYQPLDYRVVEFSDSILKVSAIWNGKPVNSEYRVVQ